MIDADKVTYRARTRRIRAALRAEKLRLNFSLTGLYFRRFRVKLCLFILKAPDQIAKLLLVFFRHDPIPPGQS
jgi:hypothetical protein